MKIEQLKEILINAADDVEGCTTETVETLPDVLREVAESLQGKAIVPVEPEDDLIDFMQSEFEDCKRMMMNNGQAIYMTYKAMLQASREKDNED